MKKLCIHCSGLFCFPGVCFNNDLDKSKESQLILYRIKDLVWREGLTRRTCHQCHQLFTELDWSEDNWEVHCRDLDWNDFATKTSRGWLAIELELEHGDCPKKKRKESD